MAATCEDEQFDHAAVAKAERPFAFVALLVSMAAFVAYLFWNGKRASVVADDVIEEVRFAAIRNGEISLSGVLAEELVHMKKQAPTESSSLNTRTLQKRVEQLTKPFFNLYDRNGGKRMDIDELQLFCRDMGELITREDVDRWFSEYDKDKSGFIDIHELSDATLQYLVAKYEAEQAGKSLELDSVVVKKELPIASGGDDDEEEGEEEVPEDLAHLSIHDQQRKIKMRAAYQMFVGTALVLLFSDPMVDVLSEVGQRTGIPAFYVSFIVAPLASNTSELIAAYNYASKKTSKTISISISALLGAACMNNTFCLGIFAALLFFKGGLVWEFTAETVAILFVELAMGYIAMKKTMRLKDAVIVLLLYPFSIFLVAFLENTIGLD